MTTNCRKGRRKLRLFNQNPHCHWCGVKTILFVPKPGHGLPGNAATVDHLYSRLDPRRKQDHSVVLACHKCNHARGRAEYLALPIEEQRLRSLPGLKARDNRQAAQKPKARIPELDRVLNEACAA